MGAILLDLASAKDCAVLWEVANLVGVNCYDFYLSDEKGSEVYLLHHHDCIYISIPDREKREGLLVELARWPNLIKDCSGYTTAVDHEYWPGKSTIGEKT
jgi:hypothetical protein